MKYSEERREAILRKLLPPHKRTVAEVAETGVVSMPVVERSSESTGAALQDPRII